MRTTNDTSKLGHATLEDRDMRDDTALNAATGGTSNAAPTLYKACCQGTHLPEVKIEL
jgi:hypothetical protein